MGDPGLRKHRFIIQKHGASWMVIHQAGLTQVSYRCRTTKAVFRRLKRLTNDVVDGGGGTIEVVWPFGPSDKFRLPDGKL